MQCSLKSCVIYWGISVLEALQFFNVLGICTCTVHFLALSCCYFLIVFEEWQNFESWLFSCLHVCPSMPNLFQENVNLIQLVPHYCELIAGGVNLPETLYGEWSWSTNKFSQEKSIIPLPVIPPNNWCIAYGALRVLSGTISVQCIPTILTEKFGYIRETDFQMFII